MRLSRPSDTASELHLDAKDGDLPLLILFSYQTPAAARLPNGRIVKTPAGDSAMRARHIAQFIARNAHQPPVIEVKQSVLDMMLRNATS